MDEVNENKQPGYDIGLALATEISLLYGWLTVAPNKIPLRNIYRVDEYENLARAYSSLYPILQSLTDVSDLPPYLGNDYSRAISNCKNMIGKSVRLGILKVGRRRAKVTNTH